MTKYNLKAYIYVNIFLRLNILNQYYGDGINFYLIFCIFVFFFSLKLLNIFWLNRYITNLNTSFKNRLQNLF